MSYIEEAFKEICKDTQAPKTWYVALCVNERRYGGAEEGGWWYDHAEVLEYQAFPDEETARSVRCKVEERAAELSKDSERRQGEAALRSMEWLEARGLDADYLPEMNGPEEYFVSVTETVPNYQNSKPSYE